MGVEGLVLLVSDLRRRASHPGIEDFGLGSLGS